MAVSVFEKKKSAPNTCMEEACSFLLWRRRTKANNAECLRRKMSLFRRQDERQRTNVADLAPITLNVTFHLLPTGKTGTRSGPSPLISSGCSGWGQTNGCGTCLPVSCSTPTGWNSGCPNRLAKLFDGDRSKVVRSAGWSRDGSTFGSCTMATR